MMAEMTAEQISEMVLDLYAARPEAKEYLDFFVAPDIDKRLDKARSAIRKELGRNSRGRNKSRSTKVRRYIKDISSLNPGAEAVAEIMTSAVELICEVGNDQWIKAATQAGYGRLLHDTVVYIDAAGLLGDYLPRLESAVGGMGSSPVYVRDFKRVLSDELKDSLESL